MDALLSQERTTYNHVKEVFGDEAAPFATLFATLDDYRTLCLSILFSDFTAPESRKVEARLWAAHSLGKSYFQRHLNKLRKLEQAQPVEARQLQRVYKDFLKNSQRFYRHYIYNLSANFGGIPKLQHVAQQVKIQDEAEGGSLQQRAVSPEMQECILNSAHQTLVYLGDLCRYRASDKLDKKPDFGPAIGFYGLACTVRPNSGLGHHQQAVVALEQRQHLRAIYHLYRAIVVGEPHPNAAKNLRLEFDKVNTAWDRGDLIQKTHPNDPDAAKRALIGWFVRFHSMCSKGEEFRGFEELERELLAQLSSILKQRSLEAAFTRIVLTNIAAQEHSGDVFKDEPTAQSQQSFFFLFRMNIKTFTTLLELFYDDLREVYSTLVDEDADGDEVVLASRLEPTACRTLPGLRLYTSWMVLNTKLVCGLADDPFLSGAIEQLWRAFAKTLSLTAGAFSIWDLEELPEITYLLEEDVEALGFKPFMSEELAPIWHDNTSAAPRKPFSDINVERLSAGNEMLGRVRDFLSAGLNFATDDETPIKLKGTRVSYKEEEPLPLPRKTIMPAETASLNEGQSKTPAKMAKPTSWASIAANGHARGAPKSAKAGKHAKVNGMPAATSVGSSHSRHAQLSRMVDDLVDEDDGSDPVTPPPHQDAHPVVVATNGDVHMDGTEEFKRPEDSAKVSRAKARPQKPAPTTPKVQDDEPINDDRRATPLIQQNLSSIWGSPNQGSSPFPPGLPMGTLSSPVHLNGNIRTHSRVNSTGSILSHDSQKTTDRWNGGDETPVRIGEGPQRSSSYATGYASLTQHGIESPLLFGASGGPWAPGPRASFGNVTSPTVESRRPK
ncbi:hypothetical protein K431DRAFT_295862 [Polychaeton citri CBS 116435]|uniref:DNA/RNA-binding domain-containing protein n=1 Tax=Polychaeton citri CBS 116435 TaxID=1314669 RepID=A0A9P4UL37_9PEZI|nr:hypothetical protein K431DRAFT_295862 [Polychaeton citri CBS 116435]